MRRIPGKTGQRGRGESPALVMHLILKKRLPFDRCRHMPADPGRMLLCRPALVPGGMEASAGKAVHGVAVAHHALHPQGGDGILREIPVAQPGETGMAILRLLFTRRLD